MLDRQARYDNVDEVETTPAPLEAPAVGRSTLTQRHVVQLTPDQRAAEHGKMDAAWAAKAGEYKPPSWASAAASPGGGEAHVGTLYFHTKQSNLDARDEQLMAELATAYATFSVRGRGRRGGQLGFTGRVVGYADPRRSIEPNNQELSRLRASHTASSLTSAAARATQLDHANFPILTEGGGVDADPGPGGVEGDNHAMSRRAEIFVDAQVTEPAHDTGPAPVGKRDEHVPPPSGSVPTDFDRMYADGVKRGDRDTLNGLAIRAYSVAESDVGTVGLTFQTIGIRPVKPPWWDGRGAAFEPQGRGKRGGRGNEQVRRGEVLLRDIKEYAYWHDQHMAHGSTFSQYLALYREARQDPAKLAELRVPLAYLYYMMKSIRTDAAALMHATD